MKLKDIVNGGSLYDSGVLDIFENTHPELASDVKQYRVERAFSGRTLLPKRTKKRGVIFTTAAKKNTFLRMYDEFQESM